MFEVGDKVRIIGKHRTGKEGVVRYVYVEGTPYPYRVEFPDAPYWPLFTADEMERID